MPKITVGDPTKLITKPIEGVYNAVGSVAGNLVGNVGGVAGQAVGQVGEIMSQPGAGAALGIAGAAFGVPAVGALANGFAPGPSGAPTSSPVVMSIPSQNENGMNTGIMMMIGGGVLALVVALVLIFKKR